MRRPTPRTAPGRRGLALIEVTVSTMLVGLLLVASLRTVGAVLRYRGNAADQQRGALLAEDLLEEILAHPYGETDGLSLGGTASLATDRMEFETIDDYHGWKRSPPEDRGGNELEGFADWERRVVVERVDPADPRQPVSSDRGAKRITVTVRHRNGFETVIQAIRTDHESS
jgi:hypothetical protein